MGKLLVNTYNNNLKYLINEVKNTFVWLKNFDS